MPGAPYAGLHLVGDEQRAGLVGEPSRGDEELVGERPDAALALHRLEHDAAVSWPAAAASAAGVVRLRERDAGDERLERGRASPAAR